MLGIEHNLLVYGAGPGWSYTEMRGFGSSLGPWLWFKLYWAAWALLLAVVARLLWVRGRESGLGVRLQLARRRFTRPTAWTAAAAAALILTLGGFIFYNTNVLNAYLTASEIAERRAEYERRYRTVRRHPAAPADGDQPARRDLSRAAGGGDPRHLPPRERAAHVPIDSIHVATAPGVETGAVDLRPAGRARCSPTRSSATGSTPSSSRSSPATRCGSTSRCTSSRMASANSGVDPSVVANGTYFTKRLAARHRLSATVASS